MEKLQHQLTDIENQLLDPTLYTQHKDRAQALQKQQAQLRQELAQVEEQWLEKSEALERLNDPRNLS